jgi:glutaredoxin-like protein
MLLSPSDQIRLRDEFSHLQQPVKLLFFTQTLGCETCLQTRQVLDELPQLSTMIEIEEVNFILDKERAAQFGIERVPAIALVGRDADGQERDSRIRFLGTPAGYEFVSLIRAILLVGGGPSILSEESRRKLAAIDKPMAIQVFSTPTCPHCPKAVTLAHEIAWANPNVTAFAVEATEYPDLARRYRVTGVPKTVVNERVEILGAVPEDAFVEQTLQGFGAGAPASE